MSDLSQFLEALGAHTAREEARLDRIGDHLATIAAIQAEQKVILSEHMRRSIALEATVETIHQRLKPIEATTLGWASLGKLVAAFGAAAAAALAAFRYFTGGHP